MITIECDVCGRTKQDATSRVADHGTWILGFDLELETANALRRNLSILDRWDARRALDFGAVHFCCEACKDKYIRQSKAA